MNQDEGKILVVDDDDSMGKKLLGKLGDMVGAADPIPQVPGYPIPQMVQGNTKPARGNPDCKGPALTAEESAATEKKPDRWPILELYERVQLKGIWFSVTRMKIGSGIIGLRMLTTEQVRAEGLKEFVA